MPTLPTPSPFIIVDGSSYLYRAFHAIPPLTTQEGFPTHVIYGVVSMIQKLRAQYHPKNMVIVFDAKGKNFRHELYSDYKAHRPPMPSELSRQIEPLHEVIRALHIPILSIPHVEADDVIGTLAKKADQEGMQVLISTGDKDITQLINPNITLINTMTNKTLNPAGVKGKFGVTPEQMIDYLTLVGDTSDNIPGVPKVGPKTAAKWLEIYGSLENIIQHADEIKGKIGEYLKNSFSQFPMTRELVRIRCDVPLDITPEQLIIGKPNTKLLKELFAKFEFKHWLESLEHENVETDLKPASTNNSSKHAEQIQSCRPGVVPKAGSPSRAAGGAEQCSAPPVEHDGVPSVSPRDDHGCIKNTKEKSNYPCLQNKQDFLTWLEKIKKADLIALDTETTGLDYMQAKLVGLSFAIAPGDAVYIPLTHQTGEQLSLDFILAQLTPILENPTIYKIGHNLKYDQEILANYKIKLAGIRYDTMLESYIVDSTVMQHDLKSLAEKYLSIKTPTYEELVGKGAKQIAFSEVPIEIATEYAAKDADLTFQLHEFFWPLIQQDKGLMYVFEHIEMPLLPILASMERHGVLIDINYLKTQSDELAQQLKILETQIFASAGSVFNLNSPQQLQEILYQHLKLPILKKTPKGQPSTNEEVLQELALNFPIPKLILQYRSLSKLKSTYTDRLPEQINLQTHRLHTSYHQAITSTGRLSCSNPNLQNIPIRTPEGRRIREAFIAPPGYSLLAADYSQIELRIMAHLSQDPELLNAFAKNLDIHAITAADIFHIPLESVDKEHRRKAKAINFGLIYGMSAFGLAKQLSISRTAAQLYIDAYFSQYPNVQTYMEKTREFAKKHGYVETLCGRKLKIFNAQSSHRGLQEAAFRAAINAPLQGTAADIIKLAMININRWLQESKINASLIMQVHDELVFEIKNSDLDLAKSHIISIMENALPLSIPLTVDIGIGENWGKAH